MKAVCRAPETTAHRRPMPARTMRPGAAARGCRREAVADRSMLRATREPAQRGEAEVLAVLPAKAAPEGSAAARAPAARRVPAAARERAARRALAAHRVQAAARGS